MSHLSPITKARLEEKLARLNKLRPLRLFLENIWTC